MFSNPGDSTGSGLLSLESPAVIMLKKDIFQILLGPKIIHFHSRRQVLDLTVVCAYSFVESPVGNISKYYNITTLNEPHKNERVCIF
jgi:hypothetical protein